MQFELRQLRYFVAVAEELHFRRAAQRLLLTQPALSHQIARLERQLGVRLFERDRRSVALTTAGVTLLKGARRALADIDQTVAAARWVAGIRSHAVRLGYPPYAVRAVGAVIDAFRERHPQLWVDEHRLQSAQVRAALLDGILDVGFVNLPVGDALLTVPVIPKRLTVLLPAIHPLAAHSRIGLAELAGERFLVADASSTPGHQAAVTACCQQAGFVPTTLRLDGRTPHTLDDLARAVVRAQGVLLLISDLPGPVPPTVAVAHRPLDLPTSVLRLTLAWRRGDQSPAVKAFISLVRDNSLVSP